MTAVVQGAVVYGIEKSRHSELRLMAKSMSSYGIVVNEPFSMYKYESRDRYIDQLSGREVARKQFAWLIRRGDVVLSDGTQIAEKEFSVSFEANKSLKFVLPIYIYNDEADAVPNRWETGQHGKQKI